MECGSAFQCDEEIDQCKKVWKQLWMPQVNWIGGCAGEEHQTQARAAKTNESLNTESAGGAKKNRLYNDTVILSILRN